MISRDGPRPDMSPKQCGYDRQSMFDEDAKMAVAAAAAAEENVAVIEEVDGGDGLVELVYFVVAQMRRHDQWVRDLEETPSNVSGYDFRDRRRMLLDSLVAIAHIGHRFLRHSDPAVRNVAELLTTCNADLISRAYAHVRRVHVTTNPNTCRR